MVVLGPSSELPPELEKEAVVVDFELPTQEEILQFLNEFVDRHGSNDKVAISLTNAEKYRLSKAATGMTMRETELAFGKALIKNQQDGPTNLRSAMLLRSPKEKKQIIRKSGILTYEEPGDFDAIGGLDCLKGWLTKRTNIYSEKAREYGLPNPKGVMLTGIPGCGKTLCARAMSSLWQVPLLRLDMGAIFAGIVGSSEANIRKAIACAEAMSPCVLMIDEIEKGLAGSSGAGDSGTSSRVFGTLLSWMNDKTKPVFVVATANEFKKIPAEMLRKGRFDEIFFVDVQIQRASSSLYNSFKKTRSKPR